MTTTDPKKNSILIILANRIYLYRLLQSFFSNEPTSDALKILLSEHTTTALSLLSIDIAQIKDLEEQTEAAEKEYLEKYLSEYTRLFIGPTKLPAPPWESVYTTEERLIFQESTLKVRQWYLKYQYIPVNYKKEADDHIGLELDFMFNLSILAESAYENDEYDKVRDILNDQKAFMDDHLLVWVPKFTQELKEAASVLLYSVIADLLREFLNADRLVLEEILDTI